jgi:hypothetical protein
MEATFNGADANPATAMTLAEFLEWKAAARPGDRLIYWRSKLGIGRDEEDALGPRAPTGRLNKSGNEISARPTTPESSAIRTLRETVFQSWLTGDFDLFQRKTRDLDDDRSVYEYLIQRRHARDAGLRLPTGSVGAGPIAPVMRNLCNSAGAAELAQRIEAYWSPQPVRIRVVREADVVCVRSDLRDGLPVVVAFRAAAD